MRTADSGGVVRASWDPAAGLAAGTVAAGGHTVETSFSVQMRRPGFSASAAPRVVNRCQCPAGQHGVTCFHMLAVAITLARRAAAARSRPEALGAELASAKAGEENLARGLSLECSETGTPARLRIDVPDDWAARLRKGSVEVSAWLHATGAAAAPAVPVAAAVRAKAPVLLSAAQMDIVAVLDAITDCDLTRPLVLTLPYFLWLLEVVGKCGAPVLRTAGGTVLHVEAGRDRLVAPYLLLSLDHETGDVFAALRCDVPGASVTEQPEYFFDRTHGYAFVGNRFHPLAAILPQPYWALYFDTISVPRPRVRSFLHVELPALRRTLPVTAEDENGDAGGPVEPFLDQFSWTPKTPVFRIFARAANPKGRLSPGSLGPQTVLTPTLVADYSPDAGRPEQAFMVPCGEPGHDLCVPDPDDPYAYFVRDHEAERAALQLVASLGVAPADPSAPRGSALAPIVGRDEIYRFLGSTVPEIRAMRGWRAEPQGELSDVDSQLERVSTRVKVEVPENAPDKFDLSLSFHSVGKNDALPASEVVSQWLHGHAFLSWRNRTYLFSPGALRSLGESFAEVLGRPSGAASSDGEDLVEGAARELPLRFPATAAPFLVSLVGSLKDAFVVFDHETRPWADHYRSFLAGQTLSGVKETSPVPEPLRSLLRPYQRAGVAWLRSLEKRDMGGVLADEMGLGKTVQTLAWLALPRSRLAARGLPALVVCPTSLVDNWTAEAAKFTPELKVLAMDEATRVPMLSDSAAVRAAYAGEDAGSSRLLDPEAFSGAVGKSDLVIASYATLRRDIGAYKRLEFSVVVIDEAQSIKNRATQSAHAVKSLVSHCRLAVTGTPVENALLDLWSIFDFLLPGYLGTHPDFRERYEKPAAELARPDCPLAARLEGEETLARLRAKVSPYLLRRLKTEVAKDLPPLQQKEEWTTLEPAQKALYDRWFAAARGQVADALAKDGFEKSQMLVLTALLRLRQICCHPALLAKENPEFASLPSGKFDQLFDLLDEARDGGHRIIVFSQFVEMLGLVGAELRRRDVPFCYLDGASKDRLEQVHRFNKDLSIPLFLVSLKAGGTGLNITGADEVVLFDPWWNPAVEDQAVARAHRIGQKRSVTAHRLLTRGTIEEKVFRLQAHKRALVAATVRESAATDVSRLTVDVVRDLFEL